MRHENPATAAEGAFPAPRGGSRALLLVGGSGTRLRSAVSSRPKPLARVGTQSFLALLMQQLRSQGIRDLVLCTGYLAGHIESEFGDGHDRGVAIQYSREQQPLGTAGAVKLAQSYLRDVPDFLVLNGDSFLETDFNRLRQAHRALGGIMTMAVVRVANASRYGTVQIDAAGRVTGFAEKTGRDEPGLINAGVYVFSREMFEHIPDGPASLERDVFPRLLQRGISALEYRGMFIDIGTPEDYARAQQLCDSLYAAAGRPRSGSAEGDK